MTQTNYMSKKLRTASAFIIIGILVEALSLLWNHPLSFVIFLGISGLLMAVGILLYLWALVSSGSRSDKSGTASSGA